MREFGVQLPPQPESFLSTARSVAVLRRSTRESPRFVALTSSDRSARSPQCFHAITIAMISGTFNDSTPSSCLVIRPSRTTQIIIGLE